MNFLDLLPDDLIEVINKHLIEAETNKRRKERKRRKKIQKRKNEYQNNTNFVKNHKKSLL